MSIKRKFFSIITLAFAVVAFSTFVSAQDSGQTNDRSMKEGKSGKRGMSKGMRGGGGNVMRELRGIELTENQRTQIKSMMETQRATFEPQREEMKSLMMKKRDGSLTEADQARLSDMKSQIKASSEQMRISVMALLTPEQTAQVTRMRAEREQQRQERRQKWQERKQQGEKPTDN